MTKVERSTLPFGVLALAALLFALPAAAQPSAMPEAPTDTLAGRYAVYTGDGARTTLDAVVDAFANADVVFLGEIHNDPTAHVLQARLFEAAHHRYGADRPVAVAFEMFERDVQLPLDEYLSGLVRERDFLDAARPWGNYAGDYRPLVEYAKANGLAVVAGNAPARYVSRVGREGLAGLYALPDEARAFLPPLPIAPPSDDLARRFRSMMADMMAAHGAHGPDVETMLAAQNLRDATMAWSVVEHRETNENALVMHLNGSFHSENGQGIPEHLARLAPGTRTLVVTMRPADGLGKAPAPSPDGFVVLTDRALVPTR